MTGRWDTHSPRLWGLVPKIVFLDPTISYTNLGNRRVYIMDDIYHTSHAQDNENSTQTISYMYIHSYRDLLLELSVLNVLFPPLWSEVTGEVPWEPHGIVKTVYNSRDCQPAIRVNTCAPLATPSLSHTQRNLCLGVARLSIIIIARLPVANCRRQRSIECWMLNDKSTHTWRWILAKYTKH